MGPLINALKRETRRLNWNPPLFLHFIFQCFSLFILLTVSHSSQVLPFIAFSFLFPLANASLHPLHPLWRPSLPLPLPTSALCTFLTMSIHSFFIHDKIPSENSISFKFEYSHPLHIFFSTLLTLSLIFNPLTHLNYFISNTPVLTFHY